MYFFGELMQSAHCIDCNKKKADLLKKKSQNNC